jgi:hypothetical protein
MRIATAALISAIIICLNCSNNQPTQPGPSPAPLPFTFGASVTYTLTAGTADTVSDSITHLTFIAPNGGSSLIITPVKTGPATTGGGVRFKVEFGGDPSTLVIMEPVRADSHLVVYGWGPLTGVVDGLKSHADSVWNGLACIDTLGNSYCNLSGDGTLGLAKRAGTLGVHQGISLFSVGHTSLVSYSNLDSCRSDCMKAIFLIIDSLPMVIRTPIQKKLIDSLYPRHAYSDGLGSAYAAFSSSWTFSRATTPTFRWDVNAAEKPNQGTICHEAGHFMNHLLAGDNRFNQIVQTARDVHSIWVEYPGRSMIEEYAHFSDFFINGSVQLTFDVQNPWSCLVVGKSTKLSPILLDFPSIEGFGCLVLARLHDTSTAIKNRLDVKEPIPVIAASFQDILGILYTSPATLDELHNSIATYLASKGMADRLPATLERLGWRYSMGWTVTDSLGNKLDNIKIQSISRVKAATGITEYTTTPAYSIKGNASSDRIFPDSSILRVWSGTDSIDIPMYVDPTKPTNKPLPNGTIVLKKLRPHLVSVSPDHGMPGIVVTLKGKKFGAVQGALVCGEYFATGISTWNDSTIVFPIPQMYARGNVPIYLATKDGVQSDTVFFTVGDATTPWQKIKQCNVLICEWDSAVLATHMVRKYADGTVKTESDTTLQNGNKIATDFYFGGGALRWSRDTFIVDSVKANTYSRRYLFAKGIIDTTTGRVLSAKVGLSGATLTPNPDGSLDSTKTVVELLSFNLTESSYGSYTLYFTGGGSGSAAQVSSVVKGITYDDYKYLGIDQTDTQPTKRGLYQYSHGTLSGWKPGAPYMMLKLAKL